ncbi:hypothetical protein E2C01_056760 [Portunus trituberculatus]|uniref:CCHC-type domain-containing protein n=1 Tax=Portunus trituberculatus TaxID=210409 RepID=A0A5B7GR85_PORTR|nr:hypothetical protein [Portunus trituberculatus]
MYFVIPSAYFHPIHLPPCRIGKDVDCVERDDSAFPPLLPPRPTLSASPATASLEQPEPSSSRLPAFAPQLEYVKLMFQDNPRVDIKLRWLAEVNRVFGLDRTLAEVKMSAVTSRFVYISRERPDIIQRVMAGEFLALTLVEQDSPERPHKFPSYLITRYPVEVDPSLSKELPGVYNARQFYQNGKPLNHIIITWSLLEQPPQTFDFSFLPLLPSSEIHRLLNDSPTCYKCWGIGHISRYCSAEKCAWCSGPHDSRSCHY